GQDPAAGFGKLKPARVKAAIRQGDRLAIGSGQMAGNVVIEPWPGLDQRLGTGEIRFQFGNPERPPGMGYPAARFEIDGIQRPAIAAPMAWIAAAAEKAQPALVQRDIFQAALFALV